MRTVNVSEASEGQPESRPATQRVGSNRVEKAGYGAFLKSEPFFAVSRGVWRCAVCDFKSPICVLRSLIGAVKKGGLFFLSESVIYSLTNFHHSANRSHCRIFNLRDLASYWA